MAKKVLSYGGIGLLAVALLAGTGYILLGSGEAQAGPGSPDGREQGHGVATESRNYGSGTIGQGAYGRSDGAQGRRALGSEAFETEGAIGERGRRYGAGQERNETVRTAEWEAVTGRVTVVDNEIAVQTTQGEVIVGLGQASYREGFALAVGDEVAVTGFYEDGEFKAGTVENLTTGQTIVLRDETGRPMWAGRGRSQNQETRDD